MDYAKLGKNFFALIICFLNNFLESGVLNRFFSIFKRIKICGDFNLFNLNKNILNLIKNLIN